MSKRKKQDDLEYVEDLSVEAPKGAKAEERLKKIKNKLKSCEKERGEYLAGWQRAKADLINYKKEQEEKNSQLFKFANEAAISEILPVLDSFEQAMKHDKNEGIKQLYNQLKNILKNQGLEEIKAVGEKFNPELHESVEEIKGKKQGVVIEEIQKGYKLNGKVIRPSRVKISK
jgi:molecular chaperone GrpE